MKSNFCDYKDAYILVKGNIIVAASPVTQAAIKKCAPSIKCITKIDETTTDDAEDLDLVRPILVIRFNRI